MTSDWTSPWGPQPERPYDGMPADMGVLPMDTLRLSGVQITTGLVMEQDGSRMQPLIQLYLQLTTLNNKQRTDQLIVVDEQGLAVLHQGLADSLAALELMRRDGVIK